MSIVTSKLKTSRFVQNHIFGFIVKQSHDQLQDFTSVQAWPLKTSIQLNFSNSTSQVFDLLEKTERAREGVRSWGRFKITNGPLQKCLVTNSPTHCDHARYDWHFILHIYTYTINELVWNKGLRCWKTCDK